MIAAICARMATKRKEELRPDLRRPIDQDKAAWVSEILKEGFPGDEVLDSYAADRVSQFYQISRGITHAHRVYVSREFFDDHTAKEIQHLLREWRAVDTIKAAGSRLVMITNDGIETVGS